MVWSEFVGSVAQPTENETCNSGRGVKDRYGAWPSGISVCYQPDDLDSNCGLRETQGQ